MAGSNTTNHNLILPEIGGIPTRDTLDIGGREYVASATDAGLLLDFGGGDSILLAGVDEWWPA